MLQYVHTRDRNFLTTKKSLTHCSFLCFFLRNRKFKRLSSPKYNEKVLDTAGDIIQQ